MQNLFNVWSDVSYKVQRLNNIETAESERKTNQEFQKFLTPDIKFDIPPAQKTIWKKPKIALLREQGINGHYDMAAALMAAGFEVHDVHMSQIATKIKNFDEYSGLVIPGGFSYGDVLGAGSGMSNTTFNQEINSIFPNF